jgi:hypothetical protein
MFKSFFTLCLSLFALLAADGTARADDLLYAVSHGYTPLKQPPRYWEVGVTSKPPPKGVHPEYAVGKPDGRLAGWARKKGDLVLGFDCKNGIRNVDGPDLFIWHFGPGGTRIYVSTEPKAPTEWHLLGDLPGTEEHVVEQHGMEFGELDKVFFVRIEKWDSGFWGKGRFIDAVAGVPGE